MRRSWRVKSGRFCEIVNDDDDLIAPLHLHLLAALDDLLLHGDHLLEAGGVVGLEEELLLVAILPHLLAHFDNRLPGAINKLGLQI